MLARTGSVVNFGHRGAPHVAPENTLSSCAAALELGAHGVEFDVRLSKDNELVLMHDSSVDRTTDGSGLVRDLTLRELKRLDAGGWFHPRYEGERIPTLQEVLEAFGRELLMNIELKGSCWLNGSLEKRVIARIEEHGLADRVMLSSFDPLALKRAKKLNPALQTGLLLGRGMSARSLGGQIAALVCADAIHPHQAMVNPAYVRQATRRGYRLNVWTVNEQSVMKRLIALGVDGIITDQPDVLAEMLAMPNDSGGQMMSEEHPLVQLARSTIESYIGYGSMIDPPQELSAQMKRRAGVFVSLHSKGNLRGCIGTIEPTQANVAQEIIHNAVNAATEDPRFPPVRPDELGELEISVDVLTEPEKVESEDQLDPKRYGVVVRSGVRRGLLLPDLEGVDTVRQQVDIARRKAWIDPGEKVELYRFEVIRYH